MHLNTAVLDAMLPIAADLAAGLPVPNERWLALPALAPVLEHGGVTIEQWRAIWETPARGESLNLPMRQQLVWNAARTALTRLEQVGQVAALLTPALLAEQVTARVMACLPPGAAPGAEMHLALGTCSGGFVSDDGSMYVDLATLLDLAGAPEALAQFLAHETWHTAHARALEGHPHSGAPGFMVLASTQPEGMVNHLIGGTYEWACRTAAAGGPDRERALQFVAYADSMEANLPARMGQFWSALTSLLDGDKDGYRTYQATLPDMPGCLHGVVMARTVDRVLGRDTLLATLSDPAAFFLAYHRAAGVPGSQAERLIKLVR